MKKVGEDMKNHDLNKAGPSTTRQNLNYRGRSRRSFQNQAGYINTQGPGRPRAIKFLFAKELNRPSHQLRISIPLYSNIDIKKQ